MTTLAPIAMISALAQGLGFKDENRKLDTSIPVVEAWAYLSPDSRYRISASKLKQKQMLTEIFMGKDLVFQAKDYHVTANQLSAADHAKLYDDLIRQISRIDFNKFQNEFPAVSLFLLLEVFVLEKGQWDTVQEMKLSNENIICSLSESLFDGICIDVESPNTGKLSAETFFDPMKFLTDQKKIEISRIIKNQIQ